MSKTTNPTSAQAQLAAEISAATEAGHDLAVLAAALGVPVGRLLLCLAKQVSWIKLIQCLKAGGAGKLLECLGDSVDWPAIIQCATEAFGGKDEGSFG